MTFWNFFGTLGLGLNIFKKPLVSGFYPEAFKTQASDLQVPDCPDQSPGIWSLTPKIRKFLGFQTRQFWTFVKPDPNPKIGVWDRF